MANDQTLRIKFQGDVSNIIGATEKVKTSVKGMGVAVSKQFVTMSKDGKTFVSTLVLVDAKLRKIQSTSKSLDSTRQESLRITKDLDNKKLASVKDRVTLEKAVIEKGVNSIIAIKQRAAIREKQIAERLSKKLIQLRNQFAEGKIPFIRQAQLRDKAIKSYETGLKRVTLETKKQISLQQKVINKQKAATAATRRQVSAQKQSTSELSRAAAAANKLLNSNRSLVGHVFRIVAGYRLVNSVINKTIQLIQAIPRAGIELQTTQAVLESTLGSSAASFGAFRALEKEATRTGIAVSILRENFRNLQASMSLAGEKTETVFKVFSNLNTVSTSLHLSAAKTTGVFNAIAQIFNKTKVQSEELVKQLGNLLPGAFASFAAANKLTTQQLIKDLDAGLVFAHDKVLAFTDFLAERFTTGFAIASVGLQANIGRLNTSFTLLGEAIFEATKGPMTAALKGLTSFATQVKEFLPQIKQFINLLITGLAFALTRTGVTAVIASTNLFRLTTATGTYTGAALFAAQATRVWAGALAFLSAPGTIIAGLALLAIEFSKVGKSADRSAQNLRDFLEERKRIAAELKNKSKEQISLEVQVNQDETVRELTDLLGKARTAVNNASREVTDRENSFIFNPGQIAKAKRNFRQLIRERVEAEKLLKAERERASSEIIAAKKEENERLVGLERSLAKQQSDALNVANAAAENKRQAAARKLEADRKRKAAELQRFDTFVNNLNIKLLTLQGNLEQANALKIELELSRNIQQAGGDTGLIDQAIQLADIQAFENNITTSKQKQLAISRDLQQQASIVNAQRSSFAISEIESLVQLDDLRELDIARLKQLISVSEAANRSIQGGSVNLRESIRRSKEELALLVAEGSNVGNLIKGSLESNLGNAFESFITGAKSAGDAMVDFATDVLKQVARIAANQLANSLINGLLGLVTGAGAGAGVSAVVPGLNASPVTGNQFSVLSLLGSSKGNIIEQGNIVPFAKGGIPDVGSRKEIFPLANGGLGSLREKGPEAILPLGRTPSGELGVKSLDGTGGSAIIIQQLNVSVTENDNESAEEQATNIGRAVKEQLKVLVRSEIADTQRSGGLLNPTQAATSF